MRLLPHLVFLLGSAAAGWGAAPEQFPGSSDKWRHFQSPGFELYSGASDGESRDLLHSLELLRATFLETFKLQERRPLPVTVFYFGDERDFRAYTPAAYKKNDRFSGYYLHHSDRAVILMMPRDDDRAARRTIFHEYIHHLMRVTEENPPPWYNEGMAEMFSTLEEEKDHVLFGRAIPGRVAELQQAALMPLEELFAVTHNSPVFREGRHTGLFYAQSWGLVHFCYLGLSRLSREQLELFLRAARSPKLAGQPGKLRELTRELLGLDYPDLNRQLGLYMRGGRYNVAQLPKPVLADPKTYPVRPVPGDEIQLRLAEVEARVNRTARAKYVLIDAAGRNAADPRLHEILGMLAREEGDTQGARERWGRAVEAGTTNPAIYHELGQMEGRGWFQSFNLNFRLPDEVAGRLRDLLQRSIAAAPNQTAAYEMLAWVEATANATDIANANLVQEHFPKLKEQDRTLLALALIRFRNNDPSTAAGLLAALAKSEPDDWTAFGLEQLSAKIEGRPPQRVTRPGTTRGRYPPPPPAPKIKVPELQLPGK